jgi:hypothetical protein
MIEMMASTTNTQEIWMNSESYHLIILDLVKALTYFCGEKEAIELNSYFNSEQVSELVTLLVTAMYNHNEFGKPYIQPVYFDDSEEIAYVNVIFENCSWDEWKELEFELDSCEKTIKGKVAVTCLRGLVE